MHWEPGVGERADNNRDNIRRVLLREPDRHPALRTKPRTNQRTAPHHRMPSIKRRKYGCPTKTLGWRRTYEPVRKVALACHPTVIFEHRSGAAIRAVSTGAQEICVR
jgi:hypothetical protein